MSDEAREALVARITEDVERSISEQEAKKYRNIYISLGFISFIGFGVISQLVDFYATKAIENKLSAAIESVESAKILVGLQSFAIKLDVSDSFTHVDRSTVMSLLTAARDNKAIRSDLSFVGVLEKIIDSFAASDNSAHLDRIVDMYEDECLLNSDIAITLLQHYGRNYLASVNVDSEASQNTYARLGKVVLSLSAGGGRGAGWAFSILAEYRRNGEKKSESLSRTIQEMAALSPEEMGQFRKVLAAMSDPDSLAKRRTPEIMRIATVTRQFIRDHDDELAKLGKAS